MIDSTPDIKKFASEKVLKRLAELAKSNESELVFYPNGRVYRNDELIAEDPSEEQAAWSKNKMKRWCK